MNSRARKQKDIGLIQIILIILLLPLTCFAWEGFDYESGHYITIHKRKGKQIRFYDYTDGKEHRGEILGSGDGDYKLGIFDYETGKIRLFDMERE
ncbi:MAG: DUF5334 domain-containing protein [Omnitrophica bacterium]|nr:DUF5334 domain-containing protein [Candidatus Omnitrophota bacterium]